MLEHSDHCQINQACLCSVSTCWYEIFIFLRRFCELWSQLIKGPRKEGKKAGGKGQPTEEVASNPSSINYSSFYGDGEPESPARYLCDEGDISPDYDYWQAHGNGPDAIIQSMTDLPVTFSG